MTARPSSLLLPGAFALAAALAAPREGAAIPFARRISLHAELSAGTVIAAPDGYPYDFGMLATGRFNLLLGGPVRLQLSAVQGIFPSSQRPTSVNNNYMLGLRFAPRTVRPEGRLFVDAEAGLAISGFNWRPGFDIGVGWEIAVSRYLHLGPVLRYSHIYQPDDEPAPEDARYITLGLSFAIYPSPPPGPRSGSLVAIGLGNDEDRDYDGVPDELDQCIDVVEDHDGFQDEDGCPDLDDDHDGLPDSEDRCPRAAETANGFEDEDGCPDTPPETQEAITLEGNQIRLRQRVYFGNNRVQVPALFMPVMTELARLLVAHPEVRRVRVEGHADDRGTRREGFSLSLRRAQSIVQFLVAQGVEPERLEPVGVGDLQPLDTAHDEVTRARNRRIEFVVTDGPAGTTALPLPEGVWTRPPAATPPAPPAATTPAATTPAATTPR
jgi:outer membrane protein OmpA-like peptidoglycan-associated protein